MKIEEFYIELNNFDTLKVSIWQDYINHKEVFYAKYINVNMPSYNNLKLKEQNESYGIDYCEENNGSIIYYTNKGVFINNLKKALKSNYRLSNQIK